MMQPKRLFRLITFGVIVTLSASSAAQTLREQARQSRGKPVGSGLLRDISPKSIEALAAESDVVLIGRLSKGKSYLTPNEEHIYTDYTVSPSHVVAGSYPALSGAPGATTPLTITQYGGEMILEGVVVRSQDYNYVDIANGEYLLFLTRFGIDSDRYQIHHGGVFAIDANHVRPLVQGSDTIFPGIKGTSVSQLVSRIQSAVK